MFRAVAVTAADVAAAGKRLEIILIKTFPRNRIQRALDDKEQLNNTLSIAASSWKL